MTVTRTVVQEPLDPVTPASIEAARLAQQREREEVFRQTGIRLDDEGRPTFPGKNDIPRGAPGICFDINGDWWHARGSCRYCRPASSHLVRQEQA